MSFASIAILATLAVPAGPVASASVEPRVQIDLNGQWELCRVKELTWPPPSSGWEPSRVPGVLRSEPYQAAWLRRTFEAPDRNKDRWHFFLRLGGARFNPVVYLNGRKLGRHVGGYEPFELDATNLIRPGRSNELIVGVQDWTGTFVRRVDFSNARGELRHVPKDVILSPIGGQYYLYGIWDDVSLHVRPRVYMDDVFAQPSTRKKRLVITLDVVNTTKEARSYLIGAEVRDRAESVLSVRGEREDVVVPPAGCQRMKLSAPWESPRLWSPADPHLYHAHVRLWSESGQAGQDRVVDEVTVRFGFREFWADGPDFLLNGTKIHLLATSCWPRPEAETSHQRIRQALTDVKAGNINAWRLHTQPWRQAWFDLADEVGLLMIPEGAVWNDDTVYRIDDPRFWANYAAHLEGMVRRHRNNPSVIMYSIENEMWGQRMNDSAPAKKDLIRMGELVKQLDPTRLITYESDIDPGGVADVIGLHYPHEYPQYHDWPNTAYWMDDAIAPMGFTEGKKKWQWRRNKPLYIGEFLWCPFRTPHANTILFGEQAFGDLRRMRERAKATTWRWQIEAYRWYGVSGICPWTLSESVDSDWRNLDVCPEKNSLYQAQEDAYRSVAAYPIQEWTRAYGGTTIRRVWHIYNDTPRRRRLHVRTVLQIAGGSAPPVVRSEVMTLPPAGRHELSWSFGMPEVQGVTRATLAVTTPDGTDLALPMKLTIFPSPAPVRLADSLHVGLYDPKGATAGALRKLNVRFIPAETLAPDPDRHDVFIVGAEVLSGDVPGNAVIGAEDNRQYQQLERFVEAGGRVLVLRQFVWPAGAMPVELTDHAATINFGLVRPHAVLEGVSDEMLRFWNPDHYVSDRELSRPAMGSMIVGSGSAAGLEHASLLELPQGKGIWLFCQMRLIDRFDVEPAAARLLANMLRYLADRKPGSGPRLFVHPPSPTILRMLERLRVPHTIDSPPSDEIEAVWLIDGHQLGSAADAEAARSLLSAGGTVWLNEVPPEGGGALEEVVAQPLRLVATNGPLLKRPNASLLRDVTAQELWWPSKAAAHSHKPIPPDPHIVRWGFTPEPSKRAEGALNLRKASLRGQLIGFHDGQITFASAGSATGQASFAKPGWYVLAVSASGTRAAGEFPICQIQLAGRAVGVVRVADNESKTYPLLIDVESAGTHPLTLAFINDYCSPPEDRNLYVQGVSWAPAADMRDMEVLTIPPAVVHIRLGRGQVLLDQVRWRDQRRCAASAARYVGGILTELGVQARPLTGTIVPANLMTIEDPDRLAHRAEDHISMHSHNGVRAKLSVARAGRYVWSIRARGTAVDEVYPRLQLLIDGCSVGHIDVFGEMWFDHPLQVDLSVGKHVLTVRFINDKYRPPEDRNVWIGRWLFAEMPGA